MVCTVHHCIVSYSLVTVEIVETAGFPFFPPVCELKGNKMRGLLLRTKRSCAWIVDSISLIPCEA